jgi:hypothetical protein
MQQVVVLKRAPVVVGPENGDENLVFAGSVAKTLEYPLLQNHVIKALGKNQRLLNVLAKLDIEPLTKDSVAAYKAQMVKEKMKPPRTHKVLGYAAFAMLAITAATFWWGKPQESGVLALCGLIATFILVITWIVTSPNPWAWQRTWLKYYKEPVPEFVLRKAMAIKEELPDAEYFIEHLGQKQDPFLCVIHNGWTEYVEVWAEPKFELQL